MNSSDVAGLVGFWITFTIFLIIAYYVFLAISLAKIFVKLGEQGWKAWIPFINTITMYELGGYTALWTIALFFPVIDFVALVILILAINNMNKRLGYGGGFTFLAIFFYPIWAGVVGFSRRGEGGVILPKPQSKAKAKADSISTGSYPVLAAKEETPGEVKPAVAKVQTSDSRVEVMDASNAQTGEWEPVPAPTSVETQPAPGNSGRKMVPPPPPPANSTGQVSPVPPPPPVGVPAPQVAEQKPADSWAPPAPVSEQVSSTPQQGTADVQEKKTQTPAAPAEPVSKDEWVPDLPADNSAEKPVTAPVEDVPDDDVAPTIIKGSVAAPVVEDDEIEATVLSKRRQPKWKISIEGADPVALVKTTVIIGRNPTAGSNGDDVQLVSLKDSTKTVSKTHARLVLEQEQWTIWDLKSTNGVYLMTSAGQEQEIPAGGSAPLTEEFILGELPVRIFRDK